MEKQSTPHYLQEKHLEGALAYLLSLRAYGYVARTFLLKQQDSIIQDLKKENGRFAGLTEQERDVLQTIFYADALDRLCLLIEDLSALLHALQGDLEEFEKHIVSQPNPRGILKRLDSSKWHTILKYADLGSLPISPDDKDFLKAIRGRNVERLQGIVDLASWFLDLHWLFYTKHKHANTLVYGFQKLELNNEATFMIPAIYNTEQPTKLKGVIVNASIYEKWKTMMNGLVMMLHDMAERTITFIERDGKPFAEYQVYCPLESRERSRIEEIIKQCDASVTRTNITVHLQATAELALIQDFIGFYEKFDEFLIR